MANPGFSVPDALVIGATESVTISGLDLMWLLAVVLRGVSGVAFGKAKVFIGIFLLP